MSPAIKRPKLTRGRQMWVIGIGCVLLFAIILGFVPGMTRGLFWMVVLDAVVSTIICLAVFWLWLRSTLERRASSIEMINRVTGGDLALGRDEIETATQSARMSAALRALVSNLERTIRRFGQLATDVGAVSTSINSRSRIMARSASEQLASTESTTTSMRQIDQSINRVRSSMEDLSVNAEQTSTSILEMSASIDEVGKIAVTLSQFVEQTSSAIEEMVASINEVAVNTESFSSFALQTASSMVEMNATTEEIGKSARQSSDLAIDVKGAANEGREAVKGTVEGMRNIQQSVHEAKAALGDLGERSQEIGEIVRVIDEIAGQTNLLALNAAILAAQAGERGKGFAVVADEIRDLSERTSVSTDEIRTLISNVQKGVERAADQMTISADRVDDGVALTARAEVVLDKILDLTERSTQSISEIARATDEQIRGTAAATAAIEEVTKMVQQTASATQQQSLTSRKIGEQASTVRDYTKHLERAMGEQETGSRAIGRAMENVMGLAQNVLEATSVLASESASIVKAMGIIQQASREGNFSVTDLNQMANTLSHESALLNQELSRFHLPTPNQGGRITTSTVLWQRLTFDPVDISANALGFIAKAVHATLVRYGEGAEMVPGLAERWEVLDQGMGYRFHLRRGAHFHNGRPIEAAAVRDSFLRVLSPDLKSSGSWILRSVRGASDVLSGKAKIAAGLIVRDSHTIDIMLEEPLAFFLSLLTMHQVSIVPVEETHDREHFRLHASGAGPFRIVEAEDGRVVRLQKNADYWVQGEPYVDELVFRLDLHSSRDVAQAFLDGELDIAHSLPLNIAAELRKDSRYAPYMSNTIQLHTSYLAWDCTSEPFNRAEVRQAINYAIDRRRINEQVYAGLGMVAPSLLPPGLLGYDPNLRGFEYDPDRARTLLRQAGLGAGFTIEYRTWDSDEFNNSGLVPCIVEDLAAIGIRVDVNRYGAIEARAPLARRGHGLLFCGNWYADFPDSDNFFYVFFHSDSTATAGIYYNSPELDGQITAARRSNDLEERAAIYRKLDEMVIREAPIACLFHERFFVIHKPEVRGLKTSLVPPPVRYHDVWVEE